MTHSIHVGIGGWTFEPWRGVFYPEGLVQKRELEYAASKLTSIELLFGVLHFLHSGLHGHYPEASPGGMQ